MRHLTFRWRPAYLCLIFLCQILVSFSLLAGVASGQLSLSSSTIKFGSVDVGSKVTKSVTVTNTANVKITISKASVSGAGFAFTGPGLPFTLAPSGSAKLSLAFDPTQSGKVTGSLSVSGTKGTRKTSVSASASLAGTGVTPAAGFLSAPSSVNLGSVLVGSKKSQTVTLSNTGGSSLIISSAKVSGSGFSVSGLTYPFTLNAGSTAALTVSFAPTATGTDNATLSLSSNASDPSANVALSGTGTVAGGTLGVSPGSLSFGNVEVGSTASKNANLTASGGSVVLSSASSNNAEFKLGGLTLPITIASGQSLSFTVTFAPTAAGAASATLSFVSGSGNASESASGTGATIQHTVDLSWDASSSPSISGYNVYRATNSAGPYTKITSNLDPSMTLIDGSVQSGQTYYYVATAVNSAGKESGYSNQVKAVVPIP